MKKFIGLLLTLYLLSFLSGSPDTIYYVDASRPNDTGDGLSEGAAWKTLAKVMAELNGDQSDDIIKFKKGEVWREQYTVAGTGTSEHPFFHETYGEGAAPLILGSTDADSTGDWSRYDSLGVLHASYFETGDLTEWDGSTEGGSSTVAASSTEKNIGVYSAKFTVAAGDDVTLNEANAFSNQSELYIRFYVNFDSWSMVANDGCQLIYAYDDVPALYAQAKLAYVGGHYYIAFAVKDDGNTWQWVPGSGASGYEVDGIVDGDWHEIKIRFKAGTGADGIATIWYDGTQGGTSTTLDTDTRQLGDYKIGFLGVDATTSGTVYVDDVIAASSDIIGIIWKTANASYAADPVHVLYNTGTAPVRCSEEATYAGLSANWEWWYDAVNDFVAIYQDVNNPATVATGLEIPTRTYCIDVAGTKDYITIDGIDCKYASSHNILFNTDSLNAEVKNLTSSYAGSSGVYLEGGNQTFDIDNVTTTYTWQHGMSIIDCTAGTIQNCDVSYYDCIDATTHALSIHGSSNLTIENNHLHHTSAGGSGVGGDRFNNCIIQNNEIDNYYTTAIDLTGFAGEECYENIVRYNLVHDGNTTLGAGIVVNSNSGEANGAYDNEVYYNIIYADYRGIILTGDVAGNTVYNNVIYNITLEGLLIYDRVDGDDQASGNLIKNNIIHTCGTKLISVSAGLYDEGNVTDNNCFYDADFTNKFQYEGTQSTLAAFRVASGQDANSIDDNPNFIDGAGYDFRLLMASLCINAGVDVGLTRDYRGRSIRHAPDIGAYEDPTNAIFMAKLLKYLKERK